MNKLDVLTEIECRLAEIETVDEAKAIRDQAEAIRVYAKSARKGLAVQNRAAAIKIFAERRAGELLAKVPRLKERKAGGDGIRSTLERIEIPIPTAHRWQKMAQVPDATVRELEAALTEKGEELTSALIYRQLTGGAHVSFNSGESEWYTPEPILEAATAVLGRIDLDPASHDDAQAVIRSRAYFTAEMDGLLQEWKGRVWMNPPYSQPLVEQFCEKLLNELDAGRVMSSITLTNNATETKWGQGLLNRAQAVCFYAGRVRFWAPGRESSSPLQGQMSCYFGDDVSVFLREFRCFGVVFARA